MSESTKTPESQKDAEANVDSFRNELGPFVVATETTRMAMVFTNAEVAGNPIIFANKAFLSLTGYGREEVLGKSFNSLMERGTHPEALAQIEAAFDEKFSTDPEICYRRHDGSEFWASIFISPVRDEKGKVVQHFASFEDHTKHKNEQAKSDMLIDELNHRVKNTLSTVLSIIRQSLRGASDPEIIREAIESRVFALSRSHDLLTRENWSGAGLHNLVNAALKPFGAADGRAERIGITGANIRLPPNTTLVLGIALHELAVNAVKYGALSNDQGSIMIRWTIEPRPDGDRLIISWEEKNGPPVSPPSRRGFGSRVIERGLTHELNGLVQLDYRPDGVVCMIDIPAPRATRNA